jgi:hypothetical protein
MSEAEPQPLAPKPKLRWYRLTPDRAVIGLLIVECLLWLSDRFGWLGWHKGYAVLTGVGMVVAAVLVLLLWWLAALVSRWRFQFSVLALLVLTTSIALLSGWLAMEMKNARNQHVMIDKPYLAPVYDWEGEGDNSRPPSAQPSEPNWLRGFFGRDSFDTVIGASIASNPVTDAELEELKRLPQLEWLVFWETRVTPSTLGQLKAFPKLSGLAFEKTAVANAGIEQLKGMARLHTLKFDFDFNINDASLEVVGGLTQITHLTLYRVQVTDAGLEHLKGMAQLQYLYIVSGRISDQGIAKLRQALPHCEITR